jgi:hypothetical protein
VDVFTTPVIVLLYIHRPFLALALTQNPENPLDSQYAPSVLATQTSASAIIRSTARQLEKDPITYMRIWSVWIYLFSAAVSVLVVFTVMPAEFEWLQGRCWFDCISGAYHALQCLE